MPDTLRSALAKARQDAAQQAVADASVVPAIQEDRQVGKNADSVVETEFDDGLDDEIVEPVEKDNLTARELAFLSRMAPPAAE